MGSGFVGLCLKGTLAGELLTVWESAHPGRGSPFTVSKVRCQSIRTQNRRCGCYKEDLLPNS